jgi:enoyl-CoA hydratase/carnithine racemase
MSEVLFTREGAVAHVRLNRPSALNALTWDMELRLHEAWLEINADPEIRVAVLSAEGERAFCVGADLNAGVDRPDGLSFGGGLTGIGGPLVKLDKPLIVAVQGYVLGGGFEIAMCADIIVATGSASFGLPETRVGVISHSGAVHRAIRQLPYRIGMAMILTGQRLSAAEAQTYGLVNEVVEFADLTDTAMRWAERVVAVSPLAAQAAKDAAVTGLGLSLEEALASRYPRIDAYQNSNDFAESRAAFAEKRASRWSGT